MLNKLIIKIKFSKSTFTCIATAITAELACKENRKKPQGQENKSETKICLKRKNYVLAIIALVFLGSSQACQPI